MTPEEASLRAIQWILAVGGVSGLAALWRISHRTAKALEMVEAHDKLLRGNGGDEWKFWSFNETRRRVAALAKKADEFHQTLHGEHGLYTRIGIHDEKILSWATWRHDVMDKELNRLSLEIGGHDGDIEDMRREIAQCERRRRS